jgi:hypothetical protein
VEQGPPRGEDDIFTGFFVHSFSLV